MRPEYLDEFTAQPRLANYLHFLDLPVAPEANPRSLSPCSSLVVTRAKPNGASIFPDHSDNQEFKLGIQGLELFNGSELYQGPGVSAANHDSAVT